MFSVIIPNYNREKVIKRAINSVLSQTHRDFELIIVDDCSTDSSIKVISSIKDERLKLYKLDKNSGAAAARNFGIEKSTGKYISFLDSDDYFEPEILAISNKTLENSDPLVGFMWTGIRFHTTKAVIEESWQPKIIDNAYMTFLNELKIGTGSGITLKKKVFEQCGTFNEKLKAAEDTEFFLRITKIFNFTYSREILVNVQKTEEDRMSKNYKNLALAYNDFIDNHLKVIERDEGLQKKYYYKLMWLNYNIENKVKARSYFQKIPRKNLGFFLKSFFLFSLYETFKLKTALKLHGKLNDLNTG